MNLAGHLATVVTGVPFAGLLDDLVIRPLALARTILDPTVAMTFPLAQRHQLNEDGIVRVQRDGGDNTAWYPSGYAFSTAEDMSRVLRLLIGGVLKKRRPGRR
ncbi:MAG TPA: serine hydrolase [Pseudonocardiaceae bacterium]|nr:serine hydrolase [Pseudonocardiaceae bacterium]